MEGTIIGEIDTIDENNLLEILKSIKIPKNNYNPLPNRNAGRSKSFGTYYGCVLGNIKKRGTTNDTPPSLSRISQLHPNLYKTLQEIAIKYFPELNYTAIQLNKNVVCPIHTDPKNTGISVMVSIGDYEGCNLVVIDNNKETEFNTKNKIFIFDGSVYPHYNTPLISGLKYSFVYFTHL
jgi:hypothetical protein